MYKYACPSCKAKSRFNLLKQDVTPVKFDMQTGEAQELDQLDAFHLPYRGPEMRVQCASCGLVEDEERFLKTAENLSS
jgi:uncharacterized Zn finger protein